MIRYVPQYWDTKYHRKLQFVPLDLIYDKDTPGFTHRVIIDGIPKDWLSKDYNPSCDTAEYFFDKHPKISINEALGQAETRNLCNECGKYPAEKGGICQPCIDYKEHTKVL